MRNTGLEETQAGIKIAGRNINNLRYGETMQTERDFILEAPKSLQMMIAAMKLKDACSLEEKL